MAYGSTRSISDSILEATDGESIQEQIDAYMQTAASGTKGEGLIAAANINKDTGDAVSDMRSKSLGARKETATVQKASVTDKLASVGRDWMALLKGVEEVDAIKPPAYNPAVFTPDESNNISGSGVGIEEGRFDDETTGLMVRPKARPEEATTEDDSWIENAADRIVDLEGFIGTAKIAFKGEKYPTVGYGKNDSTVKLGQTMTKDQAKEDLVNNIIPAKIKIAQKLFPDYNSFSDDLKIELLQGVFRGDFKAKHKTVKLINKGKWAEAATEFLVHDEYLTAKNDPKSNSKGIVDRLDAISAAIDAEGTD